MFAIEATTAAEGWGKSLALFVDGRLPLLDGGSIGGPFFELQNLVIEVSQPVLEPRVPQSWPFRDTLFDPLDRKAHKSHKEAKLLIGRLRRWSRDSIDQLDYVVRRLQKEPGTRRALVSLWDPRADQKAADPICPIYLQFRAAEPDSSILGLTVMSRSCDAWIGAPIDLYAFSSLLEYVADAAQLEIGRLTYHVVSYHLYQQDSPAAARAIGRL